MPYVMHAIGNDIKFMIASIKRQMVKLSGFQKEPKLTLKDPRKLGYLKVIELILFR